MTTYYLKHHKDKIRLKFTQNNSYNAKVFISAISVMRCSLPFIYIKEEKELHNKLLYFVMSTSLRDR